MWQHQILLPSIKRFYESQFISKAIKQLDEETSLLEKKEPLMTINDLKHSLFQEIVCKIVFIFKEFFLRRNTDGY